MDQHAVNEQNILIVDDTPDNLTILSQMLTQKGYIVRPALSGPLALKAVQKSRPDLILLDIMMPGMDGYEVCWQLKGSEHTQNIPVLFISALNETIDKVKAFEAGGVDYINKPFQTEEVLARVKTHLSLSHMQNQLQEKNVRLQQEINERERAEADLQTAHDTLQKTLDDLMATQAQLVQSERLAALGRVVAGIAHEIKNPLNFVNNFAQLLTDIIQELHEELKYHRSDFAPERIENIDELTGNIIRIAAKITHHGQRADRIVQDMLDHSRKGKHRPQLTDLTMLVEEYVDLVYQDIQVRDSTFHISIEKEYDPALGLINLVPHDIGRVILNIIQNACYAVKQKQQQVQGKYAPTLWICTKNDAEYVELRIRDNGNGIPHAVREQIFNPFFTTKPPGKGTGLGLSICYDIVVQEHEGEFRVNTEEGLFTEFVIVLPKIHKE